MKTTAFTQKHIALGAKMVPFAGYNMPVEYVGITEEHNTVRNGVGVFDVSHMGEIWVKGPNALAFVQYVSSNDASLLYPGKVQYDCFPNGKGGIVDDFLAYCIDSQTYLLVVNAANVEKDWNHLCAIAPKFGLTPGKELYNASDEICQLAVQGPKAIQAMQKLCEEDITGMEYYTFKKLMLGGVSVDLRWASAFMAMISMTQHRLSRPVWAGLPSSPRPRAISWASASTAMISMTLHRLSRPVWAGLPSFPRQREISSTKSICWLRKPRA